MKTVFLYSDKQVMLSFGVVFKLAFKKFINILCDKRASATLWERLQTPSKSPLAAVGWI